MKYELYTNANGRRTVRDRRSGDTIEITGKAEAVIDELEAETVDGQPKSANLVILNETLAALDNTGELKTDKQVEKEEKQAAGLSVTPDDGRPKDLKEKESHDKATEEAHAEVVATKEQEANDIS